MKKCLNFVLAISTMFCLALRAAATSVTIGEYNYSIPSGSTEWNGKSKGFLFGTYEGDATWYVSNDNTSPSVNAKLMMVKRLFPDSQVASRSNIKNGSTSATFVASGENGYYSVITAANNHGTTGTTWVTQDSSIVNMK